MPEDQGGKGIHLPIRTIQTRTNIRTVEPASTIRTILTSQGGGFWTALSENVKTDIENGIAHSEHWLIGHFSDEHTSPLVLKARSLALLGQPEIQRDPDTCSIIASANAFRVLDGPSPLYTQKAIQDRLEQLHGARWTTLWPDTLEGLIQSGRPYDKFQSKQIAYKPGEEKDQPEDFLKLLQELDAGSVATLDWKITPSFVNQVGVITHARTVAGFSVSDGKLFFHIIDPFRGSVEPWSFRDLVAATGKPYGLNSQRLVGIMGTVARSATLISKA